MKFHARGVQPDQNQAGVADKHAPVLRKLLLEHVPQGYSVKLLVPGGDYIAEGKIDESHGDKYIPQYLRLHVLAAHTTDSLVGLLHQREVIRYTQNACQEDQHDA